MDPLPASLRWTAALMLLATAATHVPLIPEHLEQAPYAGVLFIALCLACVFLAVRIVRRDSPLVWVATGLTMVLTVTAFLLSRTVGLPQLGGDVGNWGEPLGVPALLAETGAGLVAAYALLRGAPAHAPGLER